MYTDRYDNIFGNCDSVVNDNKTKIRLLNYESLVDLM